MFICRRVYASELKILGIEKKIRAVIRESETYKTCQDKLRQKDDH